MKITKSSNIETETAAQAQKNDDFFKIRTNFGVIFLSFDKLTKKNSLEKPLEGFEDTPCVRETNGVIRYCDCTNNFSLEKKATQECKAMKREPWFYDVSFQEKKK